jgi:hypothetical protein
LKVSVELPEPLELLTGVLGGVPVASASCGTPVTLTGSEKNTWTGIESSSL